MATTLERFVESRAFLARVGDFLGAREAEHNLLFGILDSLGRYPPTKDEEQPYLVAVATEDRVVAVALRTPPHNLVLSEVDDAAAIDLVVEDLVESGDTTPGVLGPVHAARTFAERWTARTQRRHRLRMSERIFRLSRLITPRPAAGRMRIATIDDTDLLVSWLRAFTTEALPEEEHVADPRDTVGRWLLEGAKRNYLWEVDGRPVSWTGIGGRTPNGTRVGPVYTPPEERGRGYASSLVAAASQAQLDEGLAFCFLFTDLANPTSNHVYRAIGYEAVADVDVYTFG